MRQVIFKHFFENMAIIQLWRIKSSITQSDTLN